ncbi:lecithin retinol acyltransferase family protein [Alkaliphilus serpentinus]|uniref:Lecithin retinol acyltransferase family protein n=1 Tax=Alkaliphilus serpentinus TaxID=1482731 RepID=A0A833M977_9FIRM|nr:lecithin retinol acyltransferase family protein [Alkaliphilus serpentinus]KAB3532812.1 lecithin retinol acyltransferase family protein [Alkaliphilus serpentinus]
MKGDVLFVLRKPLWFKSFNSRRNEYTVLLDELIARTMPYKHYGVEVEDGYVIHFICDSITRYPYGSIRKVTMEEFLKGGICEVDHEMTYRFTRDRIVKRAYSKLNTKFGGYHPFKNNCEHFASWCVNGERVSQQAYWGNRADSLMGLPRRALKRVTTAIALILFNNLY